jgi:hypothetical protein
LNARVTASAADSAPFDDMSVSLLAAQPISRAPDREPEALVWTVFFSHLEASLQSMRSWRWGFWAFWEVLARFFLPRRYKWVITPNKFDRGLPVNDHIKDSTGLMAVRTCAGGMWTGLTSPSRPWFKIANALPWLNLDADAEAWLKDTQDRVNAVLAQSNFYSTMHNAFKDEIVFGTAPVICYEDEDDAVRFYLPCSGEYFLDVGSNLMVNRLYREFTYNVLQVVNAFKVDNCPGEVVAAWKQGGSALQREFIIAHAIEPNFPVSDPRDPNGSLRIVPESFPWREVYWLRSIKTTKPLSARGFHGDPFAAFMWSQVSNEPYGHGPCEDCLGDNKQVQLETMRKAEFIGKGVRPPMGASPELKNEPASIIEGNVTYFDTSNGKKGFFPLFEPNPQWLPAITADIKEVNARIEKCLYVDLFYAISRMEGVQPRNELELSKRDLERLQELGPVITANEKALSILIQRVISIMTRRKMLLPPPASLHGVPLKITYTSILRLAQRSAEGVSIKDVLQTAGLMSSAAKAAGIPDPLRTLNLDKALRHYGDLNEFPPSLFFTDGEIAQHDQIRHEEMQKAQAPGQAAAGVQAAKTLSETALPGGNTALGALMGGGGMGQ